MGSSGAAQAFAFAPNFQKGIQAAGRIITLLGRQSKIVDPANPAVTNFVSFFNFLYCIYYLIFVFLFRII